MVPQNTEFWFLYKYYIQVDKITRLFFYCSEIALYRMTLSYHNKIKLVNAKNDVAINRQLRQLAHLLLVTIFLPVYEGIEQR